MFFKNKIIYYVLGFSHYILYKINNYFFIHLKKKRDLKYFILFGISNNFISLNLFYWHALKIPDIYKGKGFILKDKPLKYKVGKVLDV
jgi:hypothetical protein